MTVGEALARSEIDGRDARILLAHVTARERAWLAAHADVPLAAHEAIAFAEAVRRRASGEPIAYIVSRREFFGLALEVSPAVLIPRPETELVVQLAIERIDRCTANAAHSRAGLERAETSRVVDATAASPMLDASASQVVNTSAALKILDLGTGSGAIALAIAHERPHCRVTATDDSPHALALARRNAERLGVTNVRFFESDWYENLPPETFDLIVSNPPYIVGDDPRLGEGDLRFEPRAALTPEGDGLGALKRIIAGAARFLAPHGSLVLEHGYDQRRQVRALLHAAGLVDIEAHRDLAGIDRAAIARL